MNIENKIHSKVELLSTYYINFLEKLIRIPSHIGHEKNCQDIVRQQMKDMGIYFNDIYPNNEPPYWPTGRSYLERSCVVGQIGKKDSNHRFILNAHIDTAPVEDGSSWLFPPFSASINDGRIYGRGALDDKSGICLMLLIAEAFLSTGIIIPGQLCFESVIEDEDSGNGSLACTLSGLTCEAALVIDGTWPARVIDAHLGQVWAHFCFRGLPTAACSRSRSVDPIEVAINAIENMKNFIAKRNEENQVWEDIVSPYFLNVGSIHGGCWPGAVAESCVLDVQVGFPPPDNPILIMQTLSQIASNSAKQFNASVEIRYGALGTPPFSNRNNNLVKLLCETIKRIRPEQEYQFPVRSQAVTGHCDLRHFIKSDGTAADACLYGPGGGGNPHVKDEFYMLDHFIPVAQNIASVIMKYYGCI